MNRRFKHGVNALTGNPSPFVYDPLAYRGVKRFRPDPQPHASKCQCKACQTALELIVKVNAGVKGWDRLTEDDNGNVYLRNAERKPKPTKGLTWNDPNRPYELANGNRSSASWRGGVYTQVRATPAYTVDNTDPDNPIITVTPVPTPSATPAQPRPQRVTSHKVTPRESRYAARMARYNARNAKQIVSSSDPRIMPMVTHRRNGQVILSNNHAESTLVNAGVGVQLTSKVKTLPHVVGVMANQYRGSLVPVMTPVSSLKTRVYPTKASQKVTQEKR